MYEIRRPGARLRRAALALAAAAALMPLSALACARDGVPSVSANGKLAVLNKVSQRVVVTTWSPFIFAQTVTHGQTVVLAENNREVARALPHAVFSHPWRWDFGDHSRVAYGTRVKHVYRHAGTYRIAVMAYYTLYSAWQPFDYVTIHVR